MKSTKALFILNFITSAIWFALGIMNLFEDGYYKEIFFFILGALYLILCSVAYKNYRKEKKNSDMENKDNE